MSIAGLIAIAFALIALGGVCTWTWLEGTRARRRYAQSTIRDLAPGHPAGTRIRPENPRMSKPLDERERATFNGITGEHQPKRRVLVLQLRRLLRPAEAITVLGLRKPATLASYVAAGKLTEIRLPGGGRRYRRDEVTALAAHRSPTNVSAGAAGEVALAEAQRPAGSGEALPPAGWQGGTGVPGQFGGATRSGLPCRSNPPRTEWEGQR